jgi:hypothetical protein
VLAVSVWSEYGLGHLSVLVVMGGLAVGGLAVSGA